MIKKLNFSWVIPNILAASSLPQSRKDLEWLIEKQNIEVIITLTEDNLSRNIHYFHNLKNELHFKHYHIPTIDGTGFHIYQYQKICKIFKETLLTHRKLLIHCEGGFGRTSTALAAIWMFYFRKDLDESIRELLDKNRRPQAIFTNFQMDSLREWEQFLFSKE